jgi:hypothetical protein
VPIAERIACLPASIAPFAQRLVSASQSDSVHERCMAQIALFEVTLRYLARLAAALHAQSGLHDDRVRKALHGLNQPSLGHWLAVWREIARAHAKAGRFAMPELLEVASAQCPADSAMHRAHTRLCELYRKTQMSRRGRPISVYDFFEVMVVHRNGLFHYPSAQQEGVLSECDRVVGPALEELFDPLAFLSEYPPVFVRQIRFHRGDLVHEIERCVGPADPVTETYLAKEPLVEEAGRLILAHAEPSGEGEEGPRKLSPLAGLEPLLIRYTCPQCQRVGLFGLSRRSENSVEYSAACPHPVTFPESPQRLVDILGPYKPAPAEDARLRPDGPAGLEQAPAAAPITTAAPPEATPTRAGPAPEPPPQSIARQVQRPAPPPATPAATAPRRTGPSRALVIAAAIVAAAVIAGLAAYLSTRNRAGPLDVNLIEVGTGVDDTSEAPKARGVASSFPAGTRELIVAYSIAAPGDRAAMPRIGVYRDGEAQVHLQRDLGALEPNHLAQAAWRIESNPEFKSGAYEIRVYNGRQLVDSRAFTVGGK